MSQYARNHPDEPPLHEAIPREYFKVSNPYSMIPRISESSTIAARAYESFKVMMKHMSSVSKMSGPELVQEVEVHVDRFKVASYEHVLLGELIRRYEKAADIKRPDEEYPEPTPEDLAEIDRIEKEMEADKDKVLYYVVRFSNGSFFVADKGYKGLLGASLSEATHYSTREEAELVAPVEATVVEVTP